MNCLVKKSLIISFLVIFASLSSICKAGLTNKYNKIAFDAFAGLLYQRNSNFIEGSMADNAKPEGFSNDLAVFGGIDFYLGGYYDKLRKVRREYLVTPFVGVQMDYVIGSSYKGKNNNDIKIKNNFDFFGRIGMMFKLKFETNLKVYALLGFTRGAFLLQRQDDAAIDAYIHDPDLSIEETRERKSGMRDMFYYDSKESGYETRTRIDFAFGAGAELVIKRRLLIGADFRCRFMKFDGDVTARYHWTYESMYVVDDIYGKWSSNIGLDGIQYSFNIKLGWVFL